MNPLHIQIINNLQWGFPIVPRPFAESADRLGMREEVLLGELRQMLDKGLISRFGPLYNAERLGGAVTLAAMQVPRKQFDQVAAALAARPQVAHNYERDHDFNMWFVLSSEDPAGIDATIAAIEAQTALKVFNFPKQREFKVGFALHLSTDGHVSTVPAQSGLPPDAEETPPAPLEEADRQIIRSSQEGLELAAIPYHILAGHAGQPPEEVMARLERMLKQGIIRRLGAIPNHYKLGLKGNGMTVWQIAPEHIEAAGAMVGDLPFVTHCYQRPALPPSWPYTLFAMVHGADREEVQDKTRKMAKLLGELDQGHDILYSTRILKKSGLRLT